MSGRPSRTGSKIMVRRGLRHVPPRRHRSRCAIMRIASMSWIRLLLVTTLSILGPSLSARAALPVAIGVLGDSYSDEYEFYPPDRSTARNWVEILSATRGLDFGPYSTVGRGEPRNRGF